MTESTPGSLHRALGLGSLTFYGIGMILGAGVYSVIGPAAGQAGSSLWLAFLASSFVALLTGLSYAELATMYPDAGAEFAYLGKAFPRRQTLRFAVGATVIGIGAATSATVAMAFGGYLGAFVEVPVWTAALALLAAVCAVNLAGIRESSWFNVVLTLVEASGLVLVVWVGVTKGESLAEAWRVSAGSFGSGVFGAAALVFFSYLGFENIANLAEEAKDPGRAIPRAILIAVVATTVLYVMVGFVVVALAPPAVLADSDAPLADAIAKSSPRLAAALGVIALFATANTALIAMLSASRVLFSMSRAGAAPKPFARVLPKRQVPWLAVLLVAGLAVALLPLGAVETTAGLASFASLGAFAAVHVAVIRLRRLHPRVDRPFRIPGQLRGVPLVPALGLAATVALATQIAPRVLLIGAGLFAAIFALGVSRRKKRSLAPRGSPIPVRK